MMQYSLAAILKQSFKSAQIMALYVNLQPSNKGQNLSTNFTLVTQTILRFSEDGKYQPEKKGLLCFQYSDRSYEKQKKSRTSFLFILNEMHFKMITP